MPCRATEVIKMAMGISTQKETPISGENKNALDGYIVKIYRKKPNDDFPLPHFVAIVEIYPDLMVANKTAEIERIEEMLRLGKVKLVWE